MLVSVAGVMLLSLSGAGPTVQQIDALARGKDVDRLTALLAPLPKGVRNPFRILRTGGAYDVGQYGWRAAEMASADGRSRYVVIGTPLTSEDVGEIVLRRTGSRLTFIPETDPMGAHVVGHRFDLRFDIPKKRAALVDDLTLRFDAGAPQSILFRMSPGYQVRRISVAGKAVPFQQARGVVSMLRGQTRRATYRVEYGATVNLPMYAGSISPDEATLVNDYWYPMIARQPSPYEITVHSPKGWTAVAQGAKLEDRDAPDGRLTRYRMDLPVVYFSVISAPFRTFSQELGGVRYSAWSTRVGEEGLRAQTELYQPIFEFYTRSFGPPPYPMYGAVDSKKYGGGALEAYTFATYGGGLPSEDAHEPAHTWWGGLINNTYLHSFWNESFAVYSDGLYHRNAPIGNYGERRVAFISDGAAEASYAGAAMSQSGADVGPVGSSLGYGKGAKVLQMLEEWLGADVLVKAMRTWVSTQPKGKPGEWGDFERVLLRTVTPDQDIKGFFDDWVHRPGFANFDARGAWENGAVVIDLKWNGPSYRMPLTLLLQRGQQRSFATVFLGKSSTRVRIPSPWKPDLVSVDPYRQSVRTVDPSESPVSLDHALRGLKKVIDPAHADWLRGVGEKGEPASGDVDPAGKFLVGSPETMPAMARLCARAGFTVQGDRLTYDGTTIDLNRGAALAVVELEGGKTCVIGLGRTRVSPNWGRARLVVTDDLGRFLRGVTEPKTSGRLTFRL
jgi:hypothetical protein